MRIKNNLVRASGRPGGAAGSVVEMRDGALLISYLTRDDSRLVGCGYLLGWSLELKPRHRQLDRNKDNGDEHKRTQCSRQPEGRALPPLPGDLLHQLPLLFMGSNGMNSTPTEVGERHATEHWRRK